MSDITMCLGEACPLKNTCKRFTIPFNSSYQSYFITPPYKIENNIASCEMYWGETQDHVFNFLKKITE